MNSFHSGWYLLYTKPRHEKKVHTRLVEMNIGSFLPTTRTLRTRSDRRSYVDEPLFPSYVFIYLDEMQHYYSGLDTEGALHYVRIGKDIARVSETVVNNIRLLIGASGDVEISDTRFQTGRQLVIQQGGLAGLTCEVVQFNNKHKILVRVDLLKRNLLLTLPAEYLMTV